MLRPLSATFGVCSGCCDMLLCSPPVPAFCMELCPLLRRGENGDIDSGVPHMLPNLPLAFEKCDNLTIVVLANSHIQNSSAFYITSSKS